MRVVVIRHHRVDDPGFIADAFRARGAELSMHLYPRDGRLPDLAGIDHLVLLGAVWSVYDNEAVGDWIDDYLGWLRQADAAGVPVLGICFGAQALATALGGGAEAAPRSEIGWTKIETFDPEVIEEGPWLEFHSDRCLPPAGARILARTEVCVQAFSLARHLAVQFHPEVDAAQLSGWLANGGRAEAERAGQDPDELIIRAKAEEPDSKLRADRLVAAALRLASGEL
jgi:GMP synthase-like glutamine amidotransferase